MVAMSFKADYRPASCCNPLPGDEIVGFLKFDSPIISVHKKGCANLGKIMPGRLIVLTWNEIIAEKADRPIPDNIDYKSLDDTDFKILGHHKKMGNDYAAVIARMTGLDRATVFDRHKKLRDLGLLKRVAQLMMQYREGIVKGKWIKHRNHTYYELTPRGHELLDYVANKRRQ